MKILILGAGAVGGYFGGMMAAAGLDVGFVVRKRRAEKLRDDGLRIVSPEGETHVANPQVFNVGAPLPDADVLLLAIKATGLTSAIAALQGAVSADTVIVPLLNGLRHMTPLADAFGDAHIAGGLCYIQGSVDEDGAIRRHNHIHKLVAGPRHERQAALLQNFIDYIKPGGFDVEYASKIEQAMWNKVTFLATLAGATCIARGSVGEIVAAPYGEEVTRGLFDECLSVAAAEGFALPPEAIANAEKLALEKGSGLSSSMLGDIRAGNMTEGDHILGDLITRAEAHDIATPYLKAAHTTIAVHEGRVDA